MMPDDMLTVEHLTKRFRAAETPLGGHSSMPEPPVIEDLSFTIPRGGRVTLFAPTGAGKTTLIDILTGLDRTYEGSFRLTARNPATIFQEPRLFPHMTVEENVILPAQIRRIPLTPAMCEKYERWLEVCGLTAYTRYFPYQLSGGMKQKVALMRGFVTDPDFVMMDEPFKSLDLHSKQAIIRHILEVHPNISLLFVTHALEEVPLLTQSVLLFKTNRLANYTTHDASRLDTILMEAIHG
mgnify:CR=1 FL=1